MLAIRQIHNSVELLDFQLSLIKTSIEEKDYERTKQLCQIMSETCKEFIWVIEGYECIVERERYISRISEQYTRKRGKKNESNISV